jgi:hypothetical protein
MEATGLPEWRIQHLESSGRAEFDYYSPEDLPTEVKDAIDNRWGDGVTDHDTFFDNWNKYPSYDETNPPGGLKFENGKFVGRHAESWQ